MNFYQVTVVFEIPRDNGNPKKTPENYLVYDSSMTTVEERIISELSDSIYDYHIKKIVESSISKVINCPD